jgi:hypothetical protein
MSLSPEIKNALIVSRAGVGLPDSRALARSVERGSLVKLRRGAYVDRGEWDALDSRDRHLMRIEAAAAAAHEPLVFSGHSAAALWGMPIMGDFPDYVTILDRWKGGGRSEPGVRRTAAGHPTARTDHRDGHAVTTLARTAIDVAISTPFRDAVASVDWSISRKNQLAISRDEIADDLRQRNLRSGRTHANSVVAFASPLSDSFGESQCRAVIHLSGFAPPELQVEFQDSQGSMFTDFFWRGVRVAAEFDGKQKYTREQFTAGDPSEVVWKEKKRADRLRRQSVDTQRLLTSDVLHPERLIAILSEAGVPRGGR